MVVALAIAGFGFAAPAGANDWVSVPEPNDTTLFALGVAGLIVGRYAARRKPPKD
ncbi:MAG: hypothetical protein ACREBO_07845 [Novosphingobium sp.]